MFSANTPQPCGNCRVGEGKKLHMTEFEQGWRMKKRERKEKLQELKE